MRLRRRRRWCLGRPGNESVIRVTCSFGHGGIPPYTFVLRNRVLLANVPEEDTSFFRSDSRSRLGCLPIFLEPRASKTRLPIARHLPNRVAMGHVIDLARLKRCLPLTDQSKIREARIASVAARVDAIRPMRNHVWLSEADDVDGPRKRWSRDSGL